MITLCVDAHKQIHVAIALDDTGHEIGHWHGPNTASCPQAALNWANGPGAPRQWGIEDASNYGRGLVQPLVATGEPVYKVNPR